MAKTPTEIEVAVEIEVTPKQRQWRKEQLTRAGGVVTWRRAPGHIYDKLHVLGAEQDGYGRPLTRCGAIAFPSELLPCTGHLYGVKARRAAQRLCQECWADYLSIMEEFSTPGLVNKTMLDKRKRI